MVSFGRGARSSVVSQFETLGSNLLRVQARATAMSAEPPRLADRPPTCARCARESTTLARVVPHRDVEPGGHVRAARARAPSVRGTTPAIAATGD